MYDTPFGYQATDLLVRRTLNELEDDSTSSTYDHVMFDFIDYMAQIYSPMMDMRDDELNEFFKSDEFHDMISLYVDLYFGRYPVYAGC